ncbi:hypothetical protein JG687_00014514, partial [Phytophthora cactorum]
KWALLSTHGPHFVPIIGFTELEKIMLRFATLDNEAGMRSDAIIDLFDDVFDMYGIEAAQLGFYACDHASGNVAITRKTQVPMIGCVSQRFNLAKQALMREHSDLLVQVQLLMVKLNTIKIGTIFVRWTLLDRLDDGLVDFIHTPPMDVQLKALHEDFKNLESVNKKLQTSPVSLLDVRALFDHVVKHYLPTDTQLSVTSELVKFPEFENGVVKVLAGKVRALTRTDKAAVVKLLGSTNPSKAEEDADGSPKKRSFAEAALSKEAPTTSVAHLKSVPPTSNDISRLFSRAGIMYLRLRLSLNSMTLETIPSLWYNRGMWDASAVAQAVDKNRKKRRVAD